MTATEQPTTQPAPTGQVDDTLVARPDAIIFVPGFGDEWSDQSLELVARKIAGALDLNAPDPQWKFTAELRYENIGDVKTKICTVCKKEGSSGNDVPVIDLYEMDYRPSLIEGFEHRTPLVKSLILFLAIARNLPRVVNSFSAKGKSLLHKAQALYAILLFLLLSAYLGLLLLATLGTLPGLAQASAKSQAPTSTPTASVIRTPTSTPTVTSTTIATISPQSILPKGAIQTKTLLTTQVAQATVQVSPSNAHSENQVGIWLTTIGNLFIGLFHWLTAKALKLFLLLSLIGAFTKDQARQFITQAATDYVQLLNYMDFGDRRDIITGRFERFIEQIVEQSGDKYAKVHIMAFSFGTIVALDTLFPFGVAPAERVKCIDTLVTIGSPFDIIRSTWKDYFHSRYVSTETPKRWLNIYSPLDILGSNFRNDDKAGPAEVHIHGKNGEPDKPNATPTENFVFEEGIHVKKLGLFEFITFAGLRTHAMYWERGDAYERNCFTYIMPSMYKEQV